ncbi:MAG TPA: hypothetical protein DCR43_07895 [Bacteroidales bacterium]|nr:MAG: hypothetical protein A2X11_14330 [Bacteroidetes bacterium GWE2_42_24]OFY31532.1 MAG: hypothetical protein A2X09_08070 [Bacteroidetes bacterium GWF2_43_11]HAQ65755.1 hypothetical protein [Bacteroidales bacterium]HBZ67218.1 hypothetical protein [Bacteroidales bacterium]
MRFFILILFAGIVMNAGGQECKVLLPLIDSVYTGDCRRGLAHGDGEAWGVDHYTGHFKKGLPNGNGRYVWRNGDVYDGEWSNGNREGYGRFLPALGKGACEGTWRKNRFLPPIAADDWIHPYVVKQTVNIEKVNVRKTADEGSEVRIRIFRNSVPTQVFELEMISGSGDAQQNLDYLVFMYVSFPFAARLEYKLPDKGGAQLMECLIDFVITEEGEWEVCIYH